MEHITQNKAFLKIVGLIYAVQIALTWFGGDVFRTVPLNAFEWTVVTLFS